MKTFIIAAISADGLIARNENDFSMDWTSEADKQLFIKLTKEAGVVVFGSATARTIIRAGRRLPGRRKLVYTHHPSTITTEGFEPTNEPPAALLKRLENEGARGVAICGGAQIYTLFLEAGAVDELYLTVEPILLGQGVPLLSERLECHLTLLDVTQHDQSVLLHYRIENK